MANVKSLPAAILGLVFGFLDKATQYKCALACKAWKEEALPLIWRDMDSIVPLLRLLGPLIINPCQGNSDLEYVYNLMPTPRIWAHFTAIARHVRSLNYSDAYRTSNNYKQYVYLGSQIFATLSAHPGNTILLPNLRRLKWSCHGSGLFGVSVFLHDALDRLILNVSSASGSASALLLNGISLRATGLRSLEISAEGPLQLPEVLVSTLEALSALQHVTLPAAYYTNSVFEALANHQGIRTLTTPSAGADSALISSTAHPGSAGGFQSVQRIHVIDQIIASRIVQRLPIPCQVTSMELTLASSTVDGDFEIISWTCPLLRSLKVAIGRRQQGDGIYQFDDAFVSLLRCSDLEVIEIFDHRVVTLKKQSVLSTACLHWKNLQRLVLNPVPGSDITSSGLQRVGVSFGALICILASCKKLSHVGAILAWYPSDWPLPELVPSKSLHTLDVGKSASPPAASIPYLVGLNTLPLRIIAFSTKVVNIWELDWNDVTPVIMRWAMFSQSLDTGRLVWKHHSKRLLAREVEMEMEAQILRDHIAVLEGIVKK